jgi:hypothetical protein
VVIIYFCYVASKKHDDLTSCFCQTEEPMDVDDTNVKTKFIPKPVQSIPIKTERDEPTCSSLFNCISEVNSLLYTNNLNISQHPSCSKAQWLLALAPEAGGLSEPGVTNGWNFEHEQRGCPTNVVAKGVPHKCG